MARKIQATHIDIGKTALREGFVLGIDTHRNSKIADLKRISDWICKCLREVKGAVIIEGHYASAVVPKRSVRLVIVLRCNPDELMKRLKKRRLTTRKLRENLAAEVLDICLVDALGTFGRKRICEIDTTRRTLKSTLNEVAGLLDGRIKPTYGNVDWLSRLEERGDRLMILN